MKKDYFLSFDLFLEKISKTNVKKTEGSGYSPDKEGILNFKPIVEKKIQEPTKIESREVSAQTELLRVRTSRIDTLLDFVSELVITDAILVSFGQSLISQHPEILNFKETL